jgi:AraC-like DNA-binding protein
MQSGLETVRPGDAYAWDGRHRVYASARPVWLFQYSLRGWGLLESGGRHSKVPSKSAFSVQLPSNHQYTSDPACEAWTFFWIMVRHDHVVTRLMSHPKLYNQVVAFPGEELVISGALSLIDSMSRDSDMFTCEERLFTWLVGIERWLFSANHPEGPREELLQWTERFLKAREHQAVGVEELASAKGMSRSNFTHFFRSTTGETPANFLRSKRLAMAAGLLKATSDSIKEIAAQTGFADANRFCKAFRAKYDLSPGRYRKISQG